MAILNPEPKAAYSRMADSRLDWSSVSTLPGSIGEVGGGPAGGATHPAPELVELGQAEGLGIFDDKGVHVGQVDARLDDGGAHQDVQLPVGHLAHDVSQLLLVHFSVGGGDADRLAQQGAELGGGAVDGLGPVVEVIDLTAPVQLPANGVGHQAPVMLQDIGLDGLAVWWGAPPGWTCPACPKGPCSGSGEWGWRRGSAHPPGW